MRKRRNAHAHILGIGEMNDTDCQFEADYKRVMDDTTVTDQLKRTDEQLEVVRKLLEEIGKELS